jgi:hypothetical protein
LAAQGDESLADEINAQPAEPKAQQGVRLKTSIRFIIKFFWQIILVN